MEVLIDMVRVIYYGLSKTKYSKKFKCLFDAESFINEKRLKSPMFYGFEIIMET